MNTLIFDSGIATETLVSAGYPPGWNATTVRRPGITDGNHRLNVTKLGYVANLSYETRKWLLGTTFDYYIWLEQTDANRTLLNITELTGINNSGVGGDGGMGLPGMTRNNISNLLKPDFQINSKRYLIYNGSTLTLITSMWREQGP